MEETKRKFIEDVEKMEAKSVLNPEDGSIPFGYFCPESDGKVLWICNYDTQGKITSVFSHNNDRRCQYLDTPEDAKKIRDALVDAGWQKLIPPKVTFTYPGQKEGTTLTRKQKRYLKKQYNKLNKKNPFTDDSQKS